MNLDYLKMKIFFNFIWTVKPRKSEISGKPLGPEVKSIYFHHVLEKNQYPELAYCVDNILIVTDDEHFNLNNDSDYYKEASDKKVRILNNLEKYKEKSKKMEIKIESTLKQKDNGIPDKE